MIHKLWRLASFALHLAIAQTALAFPITIPTTMTVQPWVPQPHERVILTIRDTLVGGLPGPGVALAGLSWNIKGQAIAVDAQLTANATSSDLLEFTVDLGTLPPGRYWVSYSAYVEGILQRNRAQLQFSVSETGLVMAIEYYNAQLGHYFIAADPDEIAQLDQGTISGWTRTGEGFAVMSTATMPSTALPVCRFYGLPSAGLDSHFFSNSAAECNAVQQRWPTQWLLESPAAFGVANDAPFGYCRERSKPLYRLYNDRVDANHRYTLSTQTRDAMLALGWKLEGRASNNTSLDFVAMCVPE